MNISCEAAVPHQSVRREAKAIFFLCPTVESAGENFYSDKKRKTLKILRY